MVADRGHARRTDLGALLAPPPTAGRPAQVLVRIGWQSLPLHAPAGAPTGAPAGAGGKLDLVAWLQPLTGPTERPVVSVTPQGPVALRLVATPLPEEAAAAARRRLRQQARKQGRTPDARSLVAAGFVALVTTLPAAVWTAPQVLALYRVRWQVELVCKRLKGLWQLDHLRTRDPDLAQVSLLGSLLGALLADRGAAPRRVPAAGVPWFFATDRPVSLWRWTALWHTTLLAALLGPLSFTQVLARLPHLRRQLCDPPRRRPQQAAHARLLLRTHLATTTTPTTTCSTKDRCA